VARLEGVNDLVFWGHKNTGTEFVTYFACFGRSIGDLAVCIDVRERSHLSR